jgi:hypothetical protein
MPWNTSPDMPRAGVINTNCISFCAFEDRRCVCMCPVIRKPLSSAFFFAFHLSTRTETYFLLPVPGLFVPNVAAIPKASVYLARLKFSLACACRLACFLFHKLIHVHRMSVQQHHRLFSCAMWLLSANLIPRHLPSSIFLLPHQQDRIASHPTATIFVIFYGRNVEKVLHVRKH